MKSILMIADKRDTLVLLCDELGSAGFQITAARDGESGLTELKKATPDLLVLDFFLPGMSGLQICGAVRRDVRLNRLPILVLNAGRGEADCVSALEMGADGFVTEPVTPRELIARIKALLRRVEPPRCRGQVLKQGSLTIDTDSLRVTQSGKVVPLSLLEFRLLCHFCSHPNVIFTREQLLNTVWGADQFVTDRSVDVCVRRLRKRIEADPENPELLHTVRGAGYVLDGRMI